MFLLLYHLTIAQTEIALDSVSHYIGYDIKVCDKVYSTYQSTNPNRITYINFGGKYPNHTFSVIVFPKDLENFDYIPSEYLKGKNICVTGLATEYHGKPQIVATHESQITVTE
jgi:hypothetical protein